MMRKLSLETQVRFRGGRAGYLFPGGWVHYGLINGGLLQKHVPPRSPKQDALKGLGFGFGHEASDEAEANLLGRIHLHFLPGRGGVLGGLISASASDGDGASHRKLVCLGATRLS